MKEFIKDYSEMFSLFEKYGFKNPIVYRKSKGRDSEKVFVLIEDVFSSENEPIAQPHRKLHLADGLRKKMSCGLILLVREYLIPELNIPEKFESGEIPSVTLTAELSSEELEKKLVEIFGKEWVFGKSPLVSSQEATTPFWGKESRASVSDDDVLQLITKEASKALKENAAASLAEKLSCVAERLTQCASRLSAGSPKVK